MAGVGGGAERFGQGKICIAEINRQLTAVCEIECKIDGISKRGTGFVGHFQIDSGLPKLVLVTCNHVLPTKKVTEEASFIFGHKDDKNRGTKVKGQKLFDMNKWWTEEKSLQPSQHTYKNQYGGQDFTIVAVKEDRVKELNIEPFDLSGTMVAEDDQLFVIQHSAQYHDHQQRSPQQNPIEISASPCRKILGFLLLYDCETYGGSSGSPVVKVVDGKLQVIGVHRGVLQSKYNYGSLFTAILNHKYFGGDGGPQTTTNMVEEFLSKITWKPVEQFDLQIKLKNVAANWKDLAFYLIKQNQSSLIATIKTIEADCHYDRTGDDGLREVITKWISRTYKEERTWQKLLDVSKEIDDHTLESYLVEHNLSTEDEPEMHHVISWYKSSEDSPDWYKYADKLLPPAVAKAIESNLQGGGSEKCLRKVLKKWMNMTLSANRSWSVVVEALTKMNETETVERIFKECRKDSS